MPEILLNGKPHAVDDGATVADLLAALGLPTDGVAVALDRRVVPRSEHATTPIGEGSRIEIIHAVGGG